MHEEAAFKPGVPSLILYNENLENNYPFGLLKIIANFEK